MHGLCFLFAWACFLVAKDNKPINSVKWFQYGDVLLGGIVEDVSYKLDYSKLMYRMMRSWG